MLLASKYILKTLSTVNHPIIDKFYVLSYELLNTNRHNIKHSYILYQSFAGTIRLRDYIHCSYTPLEFRYSKEVNSYIPPCYSSYGKRVESSSSPPQEFQDIFHSQLSENIAFFTDGSKNLMDLAQG